jgi:eukaryotic-like serine/threonine-protein kinase
LRIITKNTMVLKAKAAVERKHGAGTIVKVFISSPGDVIGERKRLIGVLERLNRRFAGSCRLVAIDWPDRFYKAHATFQPQIERTSACDIVICIFWTRLGTELPLDFAERLADGRPYPYGQKTEPTTGTLRRLSMVIA